MAWTEILWEYVLVFLLAAVPWIEIAVVIPLAVLRGLDAVLVGALAFIGNWATVYLLVVFYEKVEMWRKKRRRTEEKPSKRVERAVNIWNKYGLPGLALLGPFLIGSHIAALVGLAFGARKHNTILWMTISLLLWSVAITLATLWGIDLFM